MGNCHIELSVTDINAYKIEYCKKMFFMGL